MLGMMFILETFFMLIALLVALFYRGNDVVPFLQASGITFIVGIIFYAIGFKANENNAGRREGMLTVSLTWFLLSALGMLPFLLGGYVNNVADAYFETMSGFTTTGASIIKNVEALPHGILFWRSLLQWQGGIGMVVFTVALLPIFGGGATQMFNAETTGISHERFRPRVTQVAKRLWSVYLGLTIILVILLWAGPMDLFDAINHAFTTISTGGYSTKNASVGYWDSDYVYIILTIFMFISSCNMTLIYFVFNGKVKKLFKDEELHWFFWIFVIFVVLTTGWLLYIGDTNSIATALRKASFQVSTLISSTGFCPTDDFATWGTPFSFLAILIMIICGCGGSTAGGLKAGRVAVLVKNLFNEFKKQTHPQAVIPVRMNGTAIPNDVVNRVLAFSFAYILLFFIGGLLLMLQGISFEDSLGASITAISNCGPGLGKFTNGNFSAITDVAKWLLSFMMAVGRLEIFTVLTLLVPGFWKQ